MGCVNFYYTGYSANIACVHFSFFSEWHNLCVREVSVKGAMARKRKAEAAGLALAGIWKI